MFEMGVEMLSREGYPLPEPTRMQDGSETPRGHTGAAAGAGAPVLLGQVGGGGPGGGAAAAAPSAAPGRALTDSSIAAEMAVMREDLEELRRALAARKAGTLGAVELAEARQACNDCTGWLQRLCQLLGSNVGGGQATARGAQTARVATTPKPNPDLDPDPDSDPNPIPNPNPNQARVAEGMLGVSAVTKDLALALALTLALALALALALTLTR